MGLRNVIRRVIDHEVGVVGGEIESLIEAQNAINERLEALVERFNRLQNRLTMREARQAKLAPRMDPTDAAVLAQLGAQARGGTGFDPDRV